MPQYEIEQYELHAYEYKVEAEDEAHAIQMLFDGAAEPTGNPPEYIETAENFGMPVEQNQELADQLRDLGIHVGEAVIPSIRAIKRSSNGGRDDTAQFRIRVSSRNPEGTLAG